MNKDIQDTINEISNQDNSKTKDLVKPTKNEITQYESKDLNDDYEYTRNNLKELIDNGMNLFQDAVSVARDSESPRAFEVAGNIMKSLVESNKDLLELQKTMKSLLINDKTDNATDITNNNLILSTKDLLDIIKSEKT